VSAPVASGAAIVLASILFVLLERRFPYDPRQRTLREGFFTDLILYGIVQSSILGLAIGALVAAIDRHAGASRLRLVGGWPILAQVAFFTVTHDLYIYWFHRLQHRVSWLWRIHEAHHSTRDVDWLSGVRSHALEIFINQSIELGALVLLGADPSVAPIKGAISAIWGMFIHANLDVRLGPIGWIVNGPELHRWHHALEIRDGNLNFGTKLAIWDHLFRTARAPAGKPQAYGLFGVEFPRSFLRQQLAAFPSRTSHDRRQAAPSRHGTLRSHEASIDDEILPRRAGHRRRRTRRAGLRRPGRQHGTAGARRSRGAAGTGRRSRLGRSGRTDGSHGSHRPPGSAGSRRRAGAAR
jgi:sterol desaturase/sphingolipid hydroxylase (fatty acid hydroxylase superfamily)